MNRKQMGKCFFVKDRRRQTKIVKNKPKDKNINICSLFRHGSKLNRIRMHKAASEPSVVKYNSQLLAKTAHSLQAEHKVVTALSFSDFLSLSLSASS